VQQASNKAQRQHERTVCGQMDGKDNVFSCAKGKWARSKEQGARERRVREFLGDRLRVEG
jgi:hypothetical protein